MKLLNVGCGRTFHSAWINIDIDSNSPDVLSHDVRKSLPFSDNYFDVCYTSHLIEHLYQEEARKLLAECLRVLKPKGIVRVVVPDLEAIVRNYIYSLEQVEAGLKEAEPNYDWMMIELYDQTVRSFGGGELKRYLSQSDIKNKEFIISRIGCAAEEFWSNRNQKKYIEKLGSLKKIVGRVSKLRFLLAKICVTVIAGQQAKIAFEEGMFRKSGEIHYWMYDRFSLRRMLQQTGFVDVCVCGAEESRIPDFNSYNLDVVEGLARKPDSLFMEGTKS